MEDPVGVIPYSEMVTMDISYGSDVLKGSYYANPIVDAPTVPEKEKNMYPEYYGNNICLPSSASYFNSTDCRAGPDPDQKGVEGFESAFKDLGQSVLSSHL